MTAPVIRQFAGTIPDKGQSQTAFDTNVDAFLDWQALQFAPDLVAFGTFASDTAAALVAANLPSLAGRALDAVRVNAAADGVEFANVTAAGWALLDDADAAAQRVTLGLVIGTNMPSFASPAFTGTPTAPTAASSTNTTQIATTAYTRNAIKQVLGPVGDAPVYAARAWVRFGDTGNIIASNNVSSVTDIGVGKYQVNFAVDMQATTYAGFANYTSGSLTNGSGQDGQAIAANYSTTGLRVLTVTGNGTFVDPLSTSVVIFD